MKLYCTCLPQLRRRGIVTVFTYLAVSGFELLALVAAYPLLRTLSGGSDALVGPAAALLARVGLTAGPTVLSVKAEVALFFTFGILAAAARLFAELTAIALRADAERLMRHRATAALLTSPWPIFVKVPAGEAQKAATTDATLGAHGVEMLARACGWGAYSLLSVGAALWFAPHTVPWVLAVGGISAAVYRITGQVTSRNALALATQSQRVAKELGEVIRGMKFVRASGGSSGVAARLNIAYSHEAALFRGVFRPSSVGRCVVEMLGLTLAVLILVMSMDLGAGQLVDAVIFLGILVRIAPRISTCVGAATGARTYQENVANWQRHVNLAAALPDRRQRVAARTPSPSPFQSLELRGVSVKRGDDHASVLTDVSFRLQRGRWLGIVGASGSGKSTLLDLILGLIQPDSGVIDVNGVPLATLDPASWGESIGVVLQEMPLFNDTILANVAWPDRQEDAGRATAVLTALGAASFLGPFPGALARQVGDGGNELSGGQRQRIAIARALYRAPDLLLFDEATSALDRDSEAGVISGLRALKGDSAALFVTHNHEILALVDEVLFLADGRIIDRGPWAELKPRIKSWHVPAIQEVA